MHALCSARLASPSEPYGTDHTGEIISFSDVGYGVSIVTHQPGTATLYTLVV